MFLRDSGTGDNHVEGHVFSPVRRSGIRTVRFVVSSLAGNGTNGKLDPGHYWGLRTFCLRSCMEKIVNRKKM
jgi:hypothetical protein